ncbi:unnamed protein product [Cuscuta europaea]|uniref:Uncharacterized protein n=1 Tax=Cuscuta europaea TaxID=41803 RepID=A0A9P0Z1U4_CUSEU|nr:unnamed protein product [Cuscuta europaea]
MRENFSTHDFDDDDVEELELGDAMRKASSTKGPMNLYSKTVSKEQGTLKRARGAEVTLASCKKELRERTVGAFARCMYEAGLPFNCVNYKILPPSLKTLSSFLFWTSQKTLPLSLLINFFLWFLLFLSPLHKPQPHSFYFIILRAGQLWQSFKGRR